MTASAGALLPSPADFAASYADGGGVVWTTRVSDLETPVSALLKFGPNKPGVFLLESVQGGDFRGRYSIIGLKPDLVWRVRHGRAEISRGGFEDRSFRAQRDEPLKSLRKLLKRSALKLPSTLPPMAAGLFGYLGYDMVRFIERLPEKAADPIGTPEALLVHAADEAAARLMRGLRTLRNARKRTPWWEAISNGPIREEPGGSSL